MATDKYAGLIKAWSFSRWACYADCPFKAKLKFVDRIQEPANKAMDRGSAIHKLAEDFVNAAEEPEDIPQELRLYENEFRVARQGKPKAEQEWCYDVNWDVTGWFASNAWCRIKTDLIYWDTDKLAIVDHKTGRPKEDHKKQLSLYALGAFIQFPKINVVSSELWYLDEGKGARTPQVYERDSLPKLKEEWEVLVRPMLNDRQFAPRPSARSCKYCHFSKTNGGPCRF